MWNRQELKANARINFQRNYWLSVVAAFITTFCLGGGGGLAGIPSYSNLVLREDDSPFSSGFGFDQAMFLVIMTIVLTIIVVASLSGLAFSAFLLLPLETGCCRFFLDNHNGPAKLNALAFSFQHSYLNIVKTQFLKTLYLFLWMLLAFVPEIITAVVAVKAFLNPFALIGMAFLSWIFMIPMLIKSYSYRLVSYILADDPDMPAGEVLRMSSHFMSGQKWNAFVLDLSFLGWKILSFFTLGVLAILYVNPYIYSANAELYLCVRYHIAERNMGGVTGGGVPPVRENVEVVEGEVE
ncbi:MAG: DUF975 family protein [Lachnospiraceae bacterium]|nr:DUF975 family protein [Lachnospiraceae bacterium]